MSVVMKRFKKFLIDSLMRTKLFEMAFSRKTAMEKVTVISPPIFDHFIKLFLFNLPETKQHWIDELNNFFNTINRIYLKPDNTKLSFEEIYNWLVYDAAPHYSTNYIINAIRVMTRQQYKTVRVHEHDPEHILNLILNIIKNISRDIANNRFETVEDYLPNHEERR